MGSLDKIDGIKTAWLEQFKFLRARGWTLHYVTSSPATTHMPSLMNAITALGIDIRQCELPPSPDTTPQHFAEAMSEILYQILVEYGHRPEAMIREAATIQDPVESALLDWIGRFWVALYSPLIGCDLVIHAAGDEGDRLIVEAARLAGAHAVVGDLSGLTIPTFAIGASSVYVGPSSFAVDTFHKLLVASVHQGNGAMGHLLGNRDLPVKSIVSSGCDLSYSVAPSGDVIEHCDPKVDVTGFDRLTLETSEDFAARLATIQLGVDIPAFTLKDPITTRARRANYDTPKVIGFMGRLSSEKSIGLALLALQLVLALHPHTTLRVIGTGFMRPYLEEMARDLNISHAVQFVGFVKHDDLPAQLEAMDVIVFPSLRTPSETFAIVNLEAMAMEVPVVSFGVPGTLDYLDHGVNAVIARRVTPKALAVELIYLIDHPEVAVALGAAARRTVEARFGTDVSSTSYELLYLCLRHCAGVSDLRCARRCAKSVRHCGHRSE